MNKRHLHRPLAAATVAVAIVLAASCSDKETERFNDAPRADGENNDPAEIITMPDGFSNLATKCDNGNRIYVAFKGDDNRAAIAVVPDDPTCGR